MRRPTALLGVLAVLVAALAGCGLGPGKAKDGGAELRVTRDFGQTEIGRPAKRTKLRDSDTVMRFLQSERKVSLKYGGGFVQSIDGLSGGGASGRQDWFYFVNGAEADNGAADHKLHSGDVVQWDYRNWIATMHIPAIVGAFPQPLRDGLDGKKSPVRIECTDENGPACKEVQKRLADAGIVASEGALGTSSRGKVLRVFVGAWPKLRGIRALRTLEQGPQASGVFARFSAGGARLDLLDQRGGVAQTAGPGAGLVAATKLGEDVTTVTWVVTGVDDPGTLAAANLLTEPALRDAFAVAAVPGGVRKLPFGQGGGG